MNTCRFGGIIKEKHRNARRKACVTLPTKTPTWNNLGFNTALRVKRLANNVFRHGRPLSFEAQWQLYIPVSLKVINRILPLSAFMCFIRFSAKSTYISPSNTNRFFFIIDIKYVFCEGRNEASYII
jgi:hypothetical protein